jgi:hypothetical protein
MPAMQQQAQGQGPPESAVMREDWDNRESIEQIKLSLLELATFLNKFGELWWLMYFDGPR